MIKAIDKWLLPYLKQTVTRDCTPVTDVLLAVCDHFEPFHDVDKAGALRRLAVWRARWPKLVASARDHSGSGPKHTFFYPIEQYDEDVIAALTELCIETRDEVEIHLHHHNDTQKNFRSSLDQGKRDLRTHGLLGSNDLGEPVFGFIHGNWALDDSDPQKRGCGVRGELAILKEGSCFADFTMPSAPHRTQAPIVNRLYYSHSAESGCSHHKGIRVSSGATGSEGTQAYRSKMDHLLLVQGVLGLDWRSRKWGLLPRIENSDLNSNNPPTARRLEIGIRAGISVKGVENWRFVKWHTHGGPERNHEVLIGETRRRFHNDLTTLAQRQGFRIHYVSAREMVNILHAAEDGMTGNAADWRDYIYSPPPCLKNG